MNKRALLYAGFLTVALAVLLASGKFRRSSPEVASVSPERVATNNAR